MRWLVAVGVVFAGLGALRAQTVDYVYGIEYGQGAGGSHDTWNLDQLAVNIDAGGAATSYTQTTLTNLTTLVPGWDANGTTRHNQCINALALDPTTNTLFFTYSYNSNNSSTAGTFTSRSYALRYSGSSFTATQIYSYSAASGAAGTAGVIGAGGNPGTVDVGAGWFTKGAFYNGSYYLGVQGSTDNLVQLTLAANENSVTSATVYTNINHGGARASEGGDMVISDGVLYMSGDTAGGGSTFATETLANAMSAAGTPWDYVTSANDTTYYYQLAGLGGIAQLFGFDSGGNTTFGQLTGFTDPANAPPGFVAISGTSPVIFADLSDGYGVRPIVTPEPATVGAGIAGSLTVLAVFFRRRGWRWGAMRGCLRF